MTSSTRFALFAAAALTVSGCGASMFGGGGGSPLGSASSNDLLFVSAAQTWDLDKNNAVTCEEWQKYTLELLTEADRDGDGALTPEEYQTVIRSDRLFQTADHGYFDIDNDGKVTAQEMSGKPNPAFAILDKNKDCQIGTDEMVHTRQIQKLESSGGGDAPTDIPGTGSGR